MARTRGTSSAGSAERKSQRAPLEVLTDRECFEAICKALLDQAVDRELSSKKAFAAVRSALRSKMGELTDKWIRAFMRLMEDKKVVRRLNRNGKGKSCMLRLGNLTFRASRRTRRSTPVAIRQERAPRNAGDGSKEGANITLVPMIDQKIANLEAELAKLKQVRELLS